MQHRLLAALRHQPVDRTPVWIMRQAGRYLPEYRAIRSRVNSFMDLCRDPKLACEITLQPLRRYPLDAAILFSDILTIPETMGLGLSFDTEGPKLSRPVRTLAALEALPPIDTERELPYVLDAIHLVRLKLNDKVPLIGFSGSPWTLATYMVEGRATRDFPTIKKMLAEGDAVLPRLLAKLVEAVTNYLQAQIIAGVQVIQIFDSWGTILDADDYQQFSLNYIEAIISRLRRGAGADIPIIVFSKNKASNLKAIARTGCDCISLGWDTDIGQARQLVGDKVALQGNLNPEVLKCNTRVISAQVKRIIDSYGRPSGHIFNLGQGITPDIDPDKVRALVEIIKNSK